MTPRILPFRPSWQEDEIQGEGEGDPVLVVHPSPAGRRRLANLRMAMTAASEWYYVTKNILDHSVRLTERLVFGEKYLPNRLRQYKGEKKVAFLYHGYLQGRPAFERLERLLGSGAFGIFAVAGGYQPYCQDIRRSAEHERRVFEYVLSQTDAEEIYLVGHSQGGLVARWMVQKLQMPQKVSKCVTLATPHMGTWAAAAGIANRVVTRAASMVPGTKRIEGESALQMLPGSSLLKELNRTALPANMDFVNLYNFLDPMVWPSRYARLPYPEAINILLKKIGHMQPLYDYQEFEIVLRALLAPVGHRRALQREALLGQEVLERRMMGSGSSRYQEFVTSSD